MKTVGIGLFYGFEKPYAISLTLLCHRFLTKAHQIR